MQFPAGLFLELILSATGSFLVVLTWVCAFSVVFGCFLISFGCSSLVFGVHGGFQVLLEGFGWSKNIWGCTQLVFGLISLT